MCILAGMHEGVCVCVKIHAFVCDLWDGESSRDSLSVCGSIWRGCIELRAADISPRYSSHKSVSRSPLAAQAPGAWCYQSETAATPSGQKSTGAFLYYWSWCQACSCDCGRGWRLRVCYRSTIRRLGSGVEGCHITRLAVGLFTAGCCYSFVVSCLSIA